MKFNHKILIGNPVQLEEDGKKLREGDLYYVIMDLPFNCNYECLKCYRKGTPRVLLDNLYMEERKRVIKESKELGAEVFAIPGEGEPLMHKTSVLSLIRYVNTLGMISLIYTNGSYLDEKTVSELYENNTTVIFSLDSINEETYRLLTGGKGDVEKVKRNFEMLKYIYREAVKREGDVLKTRLGVITIITNSNKHEIEEIKEFIGDEVFHIVNTPIKAGRAEKYWKLLVGENERELKELADKYTDAAVGGLTASYEGRCTALYYGLTVDTDGEVLVCPASVGLTVGNIRKEDIKHLHKKVLNFVKEKGSPACIQRDLKNTVFKYHDGISTTRL